MLIPILSFRSGWKKRFISVRSWSNSLCGSTAQRDNARSGSDYFSTILVGAMCAAGSLTANGYGVPALLVKLITVFLSAAWIVCHKLDLGSEYYPLVKRKYLLLFCILPLLFLDSALLFLYLYNLTPDIITSCCGYCSAIRTATAIISSTSCLPQACSASMARWLV